MKKDANSERFVVQGNINATAIRTSGRHLDNAVRYKRMASSSTPPIERGAVGISDMIDSG
jgi:hypothetical protein